MTSTEKALGEFIDAWKAGERPQVDDYLQRVPKSDRDELAEQLLSWLSVAPTPPYDEATRAQIAAEPAVLAAVDALDAVVLPLPERVATLRSRAGLAITDVASRLAAAFGLGGQEARTATYLEQLEDDELDTSRLSQRLRDALASILGADPDLLAPSPAWSAGPAQASPAMWRADEAPDAEVAEAFEQFAAAAMAPAPEPMDELDRLFLGGPNA
ncbi:MAG: hypothetical protein V9E83_07385 [Baekduia sp.]